MLFVIESHIVCNFLDCVIGILQLIDCVADPDIRAVITESFSYDIMETSAEIAVTHLAVAGNFRRINDSMVIIIDVQLFRHRMENLMWLINSIGMMKKSIISVGGHSENM